MFGAVITSGNTVSWVIFIRSYRFLLLYRTIILVFTGFNYGYATRWYTLFFPRRGCMVDGNGAWFGCPQWNGAFGAARFIIEFWTRSKILRPITVFIFFPQAFIEWSDSYTKSKQALQMAVFDIEGNNVRISIFYLLGSIWMSQINRRITQLRLNSSWDRDAS